MSQDILLILEKKDGNENNIIISYTKDNLERISECGIDVNLLHKDSFNHVGNGCIAKICSGYNELIDFYYGKYNTVDDFKLIINKKDDVNHLLKQLLRSHYETTDVQINAGDVINNTNGSKYKVIDVVAKNDKSVDAILVDVNTFQVVIAYGLQNFNIKYGNIDNAGGIQGENAYEWGHGSYYGSLNKNTNMRSIYLNALRDEEPLAKDVYEYRNRILEEYISTKSIIDDKRYDASIRNVAKDVMKNKFMNLDFNEFDKSLMDGSFDSSFFIKENKNKDRR